MPRDEKHAKPGNQVLRAGQVPLIKTDDYQIRLLVGSYQGQASSIRTASPLLIMDVRVRAGGKAVNLEVPGDYTVAAYVVSGSGEIGAQRVAPSSIAFSLATGKDNVDQVTTLDCRSPSSEAGSGEDLRFILFAGRPINDPISVDGFFVCCSREETQKTVEDFENCTNGFAAGRSWASRITQKVERKGDGK